MQPKLVAVGHIIHDTRCYVETLPSPDRTVFMRAPIRVSGGGSAANVAVNAKKLGIPSGVIGNVGNDSHGRFLMDELWKFRVDTSQVRVVKGKSGMAIILIDKSAEVEVVEDVGVCDRFRAMDAGYIAGGKHLHMAGSTFEILDSASRIAKDAGLSLSFDPGRYASRLGRKKLAPVLKRCDYLIINRKELAGLTGSGEVHAARSLAKDFGLTCIIKQGGDETLVEGNESFAVPPFRVKPVDTIGAGDAFGGGLITALLEKKSMFEAVRFANAVAAAKVLHQGAQSLPGRRWIEKKFKV
jgi:ribokinase